MDETKSPLTHGSGKTPALTVTVTEAARLLGIGRAGAYEAIHSGRLPAIRISPRRLLVPRAALERLLAGGA